MHKITFFIALLLLSGHFCSYAQIINIPDLNFKNALVNTLCVDTNGDFSGDVDADVNNDGEIQESEAINITTLLIDSISIQSLAGIEYFGQLQKLYCQSNQLTTLDVAGLSSLTQLYCHNNQLTNLNVQGLSNLQILWCHNNQLSTLNVQGLSNLEELECSTNQLTILEVQALSNLQILYCYHNQLNSLDAQGMNNLQNLGCGANQLSILNVQGLSNLEYLACGANQLTNLDLEGLSNLQSLGINNNQLTNLDVQGLSNLGYISCAHNYLTSLDLQGLTHLNTVYCGQNQLTSLNVQGSSNLAILNCPENQLTTLDLQDQINLVVLFCINNQLTTLYIKNGTIENTLNFSSNPDLSYICCDLAQITNVYNQTLLNGQTNCVVNTSCSSINTYIKGSLALDQNLNCENDNPEFGFESRIVKAEKTGDETLYSISNNEGYYGMGLDTGQYLISTYLLNNYSLPCEDSIWVNLPQINDSVTVDFPFQTYISCPLLEVNIASDRMRRCFDNQYTIQYCNIGTVSAPNAQVTVTLSEDVSFVSSSIPGNNVSGNDWQFSVGEVQPGDCETFTLSFHVICDSTIIGQSICASAHITPDSICTPPNSNWSGAEIMVDGYCEGDSVRFEIKNIGFGDMSQDVQYIVIEDDVILFEGPFNLNSQELLEVKTPANGSSWRLEAGQEPTFPFVSMPFASVEGCGLNLGGLFSLGFVTQFSEQDGNPFYSLECREITGSFDPNDKSAQPKGVGDDHFIYPNTEIEYQINFQNVGTDTAFTVTILDALVQDLDLQTFKAGISSHPYQVELFDQGILKFTFDPILLPDSSVNEAASHGFVRFRITPKSTTPLGTRIENQAGIYFDFNAPVITNTVFHTVDTGFLEHVIVMVNTPAVPDNIRIFPNPVRAGEYLFFENSDAVNQITIFEALGKKVFQTDYSGNKVMIPKSLPAGVYFFEWRGVNGAKRWGKLVVWE